MSGLYIESKPLTKDMASEIDRLLQQLTISASGAEGMLILRVSLGRIITGEDEVSSRAPDDPRN